MNRKIFLSAVVVTSLILLNCSDKEIEVTEDQREQMRTTAADFMGKLKGILLNQITNKRGSKCPGYLLGYCAGIN